MGNLSVESCYRSHLKGNGSGTWNTETIIERPNGMEHTKFIVCMTVLISTSYCYPPYFYKDYWQSRLHENLPSPSDQRWCRPGQELGWTRRELESCKSRSQYLIRLWSDSKTLWFITHQTFTIYILASYSLTLCWVFGQVGIETLLYLKFM